MISYLFILPYSFAKKLFLDVLSNKLYLIPNETLIEKEIRAVKIPSLINLGQIEMFENSGFGKPVGIVLTISILKVSSNLKKYDAVVTTIT